MEYKVQMWGCRGGMGWRLLLSSLMSSSRSNRGAEAQVNKSTTTKQALRNHRYYGLSSRVCTHLIVSPFPTSIKTTIWSTPGKPRHGIWTSSLPSSTVPPSPTLMSQSPPYLSSSLLESSFHTSHSTSESSRVDPLKVYLLTSSFSAPQVLPSPSSIF